MYRYIRGVDDTVGMKLKCKHVAKLGQLTKVLRDLVAELHRYGVVLR